MAPAGEIFDGYRPGARALCAAALAALARRIRCSAGHESLRTIAETLLARPLRGECGGESRCLQRQGQSFGRLVGARLARPARQADRVSRARGMVFGVWSAK